ncbi:hypothetical protein KBY58_09745 [Cyanobium sp. HWJ4-Hawea]|uniref:hypothetical protein n=1 Tax=Cyanobium sp. HWJ4-Hawea TaxID=2823713 RepID=UPI0020CDCF18|nr:hypothetical protein [Cyanobium sp. HWJ4-Hawea]MCP9809714.1 hypothetical protein [Cyanobium sp. HWJ4-Hawea]
MKRSLTIAAATALAFIASPAMAESWKIRLSGQGDVFVSGGSNTYVVAKTEPGNVLAVYHTTLKSNYWTGAGVWYDHEPTASRACPVAQPDGWGDPQGCIAGVKGRIQLPAGTNPTDYTIDIKWIENGAEQSTKFRLTS